MKAVLHSDTCGCRLIATPDLLACAGGRIKSVLGSEAEVSAGRLDACYTTFFQATAALVLRNAAWRICQKLRAK
jgi:hypothetical protein